MVGGGKRKETGMMIYLSNVDFKNKKENMNNSILNNTHLSLGGVGCFFLKSISS